MSQQHGDLFAKERREHKLEQFTGVLSRLEALVDWAGLAAAVNAATGREAARPKGGRPPYPTTALLKVLVLQQLHANLSDEQMEYALLDRLSWQRFIGMSDARDLPDARTIWAFKNLIAAGGGAQALFDEVTRQLNQAGLAAKGGQLIDATIIEVPKTHVNQAERQSINSGQPPGHWDAKRLAHSDMDARWTAKHDQWFYGYKGHINADQRHKLIRRLHVSPANVDDRSPLAGLLQAQPERLTQGQTVFADRGYDAQATRVLLASHGLRDGVCRRDDTQRHDQSAVHKRNARLSKTRSRMEHVFGAWAKTMGKQIRVIGLKRARAAITLQAVIYNLRRWVTIEAKAARGGAPRRKPSMSAA